MQRRLANSKATGTQNVNDLEFMSKLTHPNSLLKELLEVSENLVSNEYKCHLLS